MAIKVMAGMTLLTCGLCGFGIAFSPMGVAVRSEDDNIAKLRKLGVPITPAEVYSKFPIPKVGNAAQFLIPKFKQFKNFSVSLSPKDMLKISKPKSIPSQIDSEKLIELRRILDGIIGLEKYTTCRFEKMYENGYAIIYPEFSNLKNIIRALCYDAEILANEQKFDGSIKRYNMAEKLVILSDTDPIIIGRLVRISTQSILINSIARAYATKGFSPAHSISLQRTLQKLESPLNYRDSLLIEAYFSIVSIDLNNLEGSTGSTDKEDRRLKRFGSVPYLRNALRSNLLADQIRLIEAYDSQKDLTQALHQLGKVSTEISDNQDLLRLYSSMSVPIYTGVETAHLETLVKTRLVHQIFKLRELIDQTKTLPTKLPLGGDENVDPFNHEPFIVKKVKDRLLIYSVGKNLVDDGGRFDKSELKQDVGYEIGL
jgi:hypothetical protein